MNNLDELVARFVTDIIKSNLPNIGWVIRLHPNQTKDFEDIRQFLQEKLICQNFFLEKPEHSSLYGLLKISNYLITKWSSVAYEALSFNINPIITDQNGKVLFSEKIKTEFLITQKMNNNSMISSRKTRNLFLMIILL